MSATDLTQSQDGIRIRVPRFAAAFLLLHVPLGCSARLDAMERVWDPRNHKVLTLAAATSKHGSQCAAEPASN